LYVPASMILLYKKSIHQWIRSSKLFHKTQKQKFFYEEIKNTFLNTVMEASFQFGIEKIADAFQKRAESL